MARLFASAAIVTAIAAATAGCQTTQSTATTGSLALAPTDRSDADWQRDIQAYGQKYRADPSNVETALRYAQALRASGQNAQAVAILQELSMENPHNKIVLGEYGRALADAGQYEQALTVLDSSHTPEQPDWRILSAQGAVLDQMGRHVDAQRHYLTALKIVPNEPSVLSNLGLSYALSKDLKDAEATLRLAVAQKAADPRVRQNLRWSSAWRDASPRRKRSRAPTCRPMRPPPTSPTCGRCWRARRPPSRLQIAHPIIRRDRASRSARSSPRKRGPST